MAQRPIMNCREPASILKNVGKTSVFAALIYYALALAIAYYNAFKLLFSFIRRPLSFFKQDKRDILDGQDPLPGVQHEFLHANSIRIHAVSLERQREKPLMLFLHGFPEFWYSWRHQLKEFTQDYDAVAIDMRGFNRSDKPQGVENYHLGVLASDVACVVHALGHRSCILVAHDWGGVVAWVVAGMYPQLVDRLVTLAGPHLGLAQLNMSLTQMLKSSYILLFQAPLIPELALACNDYRALGRIFTPGTAFGPKSRAGCAATDIEWYKHAFGRPGAATATLNYYRALVPLVTFDPLPRVWDALRRVLHMPVMAVMAEGDLALEPRLMHGLCEVAPKSETHVLKNCSHWINMDQPAKVNQMIREFLAKHPLGKMD